MKYTIKKGDTLSRIAKEFDTTVKDLARINKIKNVNRINAGGTIIVPGDENIREQVETARQEARQEVSRREVQESKPAKISSKERGVVRSLLDKIMSSEPSSVNKDKQPSLLGKKKDKSRSEPILPSNIRQLVYDVFGGDKLITEENLKSEELEALKVVAARALKRGSPRINYKDYATTEGNVYSDVGGSKVYKGDVESSGLLSKVSDPSYSMKTLLGQADVAKDEEGNVIIMDQYNFNDAVKGTFMDYLKDAYSAGTSMYAQARAIGKHFGSKEGEGSPVVINLGRIT